MIGKLWLCAVLGATGVSAADFQFVHPGLLHSRADFRRMKDGVTRKQEPIVSGFSRDWRRVHH